MAPIIMPRPPYLFMPEKYSNAPTSPRMMERVFEMEVMCVFSTSFRFCRKLSSDVRIWSMVWLIFANGSVEFVAARTRGVRSMIVNSGFTYFMGL